MEPLEAREGSEVVNGSVTVWRPWQLKQFELFQAVTVSTPSRQQFTQEYLSDSCFDWFTFTPEPCFISWSAK